MPSKMRFLFRLIQGHHDMPRPMSAADAQEMARVAIDALEDAVTHVSGDWKTDDLGDFWLGATESCVLRLVRLKPEMVVRVNQSDDPVE